MVFLRFPFENRFKQLVTNDVMVKSRVLYENVALYLGTTDFSLVHNGRTLPKEQNIPQDANVLVTFSLPGGKGGFGSMLRAIGAQIEKTTNREACRDLSGRRLRDVNEEQRLKKWISKESEREAEKLRRRKERIERLKSKPKHNFNDFEFEKKMSEGPERVEEALAAGLEKRSKRPANQASSSAVEPKKQHLWMEGAISSSSDSELEAGPTNEMSTSSDSCTAHSVGDAGCSSQSHFSLQEEGETNLSTEDFPPEASTSAKEDDALKTADAPPPSDSKDSSSNQVESNEDSTLDISAPMNQINKEVDTSPIHLTSFKDPSELEGLGLDRLKAALIERGLKCGGTLQDRAQRLWQVKGLQPHEYPANIIAKKKK